VKRLRFLFGALVIAAVLAAGVALAATPTPYMEFRPVTWVDMKDGKTDFSTARFDHSYIRLHDLPTSGNGTIELDLAAPTDVKYYGAGVLHPIIEQVNSGLNIFRLRPQPDNQNHDSYTVANVNSLDEGQFVSETALYGQPLFFTQNSIDKFARFMYNNIDLYFTERSVRYDCHNNGI